MRRKPDERWHAIVKAIAEPSHAIEAACWRHRQQLEFNPAVDRAVEIYEEIFERERLQAWLMATQDDLDVSDRVGVTTDMLRIYRHVFFNTNVFRDQLERQLWVQNYQGSSEGMAFLQKAVLHGVEAIAHVMGATSKLDPAVVIEQSMRETYFRAQAIRSARLTSPETAVAHQLLKTAVEHAQLMSKTHAPTISDVMLKLKNRDMTQRMEDIAPHGEILH